MTQTPLLGTRLYSRGMVLCGRMTIPRWKNFLVEAAEAMGMLPVAEAAVWNYPTPGGCGGNGATIIQPITESFLALDVWTDHDGAYFFICSCREFFPATFRQVIAVFGLIEDDIGEPCMLRLDREGLA